MPGTLEAIEHEKMSRKPAFYKGAAVALFKTPQELQATDEFPKGDTRTNSCKIPEELASGLMRALWILPPCPKVSHCGCKAPGVYFS